MDIGSLKAVSDVGLALVALAVVSFFGYRLLREYIDDLRKSRDKAVETAGAGSAAIDRLTEKLDQRLEAIERRLDR